MKKTLLILSITLLGTFLGSNVMGQVTQNLNLGMPEIALMAASATTINLQLTTGTAGLAVKSSVSDSSARLKVSSIITSTTRTLTASVSAVPSGTSLTLQAQAPNASFGGTPGAFLPAAALPVTGSANIITGIGSCYTGTAIDDGYKLKYTWGLLDPASNYASVRATGAGVLVIVTLTITAAI
jgi:hypothetical protein